MPWFGVHAMTDDELRSFYRYVKSLGEPGMPAPQYVCRAGRDTHHAVHRLRAADACTIAIRPEARVRFRPYDINAKD